MSKQTNSDKYDAIIKSWENTRKKVGEYVLVLQNIRQGLSWLTRGRNKKEYDFYLTGKQRRSKQNKFVRGEVKIEKKLLSSKKYSRECRIIHQGKVIKRVTFRQNAFYLGGKKKGNIICDLFGIDEYGSPVAGEVKLTDANPWYATVECIAQVVLMRSDKKHLMQCLKKTVGKEIRGRGAWGIVIAPCKYWKKHVDICEQVHILLDLIHSKTKIRICCVSYDDSVKSGKIINLPLICGWPPKTKFKFST